MKKALILFVLFCTILGCKSDEKDIKPTTLSPVIKKNLLDMIDIMKKNSINRLTIDWEAFTNDVISKAGKAQSIFQAEAAIRLAITRLNDNHSLVVINDWFFIQGNSSSDDFPPFVMNNDKIGALPDNIAYIKVEGNFRRNISQDTLTKNIQNEIRRQDRKNLKGWIVDLRNNDGGNMYPMICGLKPILGNNVPGFFIDIDGNETWWPFFINVREPYTLIKQNPKVAVLINQWIASSGEAAVIAFKGRPDTRFFGTPTYGVSTGNQRFNVSSSIALDLTTVIMADRNKKPYGKKVEPDVLTTTAESTNNAAIKWLLE